MKLVVSSSELLKGALIALKAVPAKASEAILESYLLELNGNVLKLTASDKELTLVTEIEVENTMEEGSMAIPARQITELLKQLPDQPLTISTTGENSLECAWTNGVSTLPFFNPADYPPFKTVGAEAETIEMPAETLIEGINNTIYATSDEENRPIMNSIFFDIKPESTVLVASDLQKLVCYTADEIKTGKETSFILNKRHAATVRSILDKEENVRITFDESTIVFQAGRTTAVCCRVLGNYPDYRTIIPQNNSNILSLRRLDLLNMVRRIAVCSPKASNHIKFNLTPGWIEVSAQDTGYEISAHEKAECRYDGDDLAIGFKSTHLIEILSNMSCEEVVMKFADKRRSALILPSPEEEGAEKVFGIVMPIMVR